MNELVKYDAACRAVAEAASIDEAKEFRDQSEAMRAYARQAKNKQMEAQAAEIRFRAERRIGELMAVQRDGGHMATAGRPSGEIGSRTNPISKPPTLEEVGIDKKTADRARKYAAIPEAEFNGIVGEWRDRVEAENARVTVDLLAAGQKAEKERSQSQGEIEEAESAPDHYAKERKGLDKFTREGLEDELIEARIALAEKSEKLKAETTKRRAAEKEAKSLKADYKEMAEASDLGPEVSRLKNQIAQIKGQRDDEKANAARLQRQVNAQAAEIKALRKENASLKENQEFTL